MGNWISVYSDEPGELTATVKSRNQGKFAELAAINPDFANDPVAAGYMRRLIDGDFENSESVEGGRFVQAFDTLCQIYSKNKATVEIYLDEETFPEMWRFAWDAHETSFGLPISEYGTPAVGRWSLTDVNDWIPLLEGLNFGGIAEKTGISEGDKAEVQELVDVLKASADRERGVYVFVSE